MEALRELFPSHAPTVLAEALRRCHGNIDNAATWMFEHRIDLIDDTFSRSSSSTSSTSTSSTSTLMSAVSMPVSGICIRFANDIGRKDLPTIHIEENLPNLRTSPFYSDATGDCAFHAMGLAVSMLNDKVLSTTKQHKQMASDMRVNICDYQILNWTTTSVFGNMPWHTIITMAHNVAITQDERDEYGDWGTDAETQKIAWQSEMHSLYGTTSEFLALCEMMHTMRVPIVFRVWRKVGRPLELKRMETIPNNGITQGLIFDVLHSGENDTSFAHYQLLDSGYARCLQSSNQMKKRAGVGSSGVLRKKRK